MRVALLALAACSLGPPSTGDGIATDTDSPPGLGETEDTDGEGGTDGSLCDQAGYSTATSDLSGQALVDALHELTAAQACSDYSAETTWMFTVLDKRADGTVECVYTGRSTPVGAEKPDPTNMNTEHSWPQSLGAEDPPAECDLHHLYPTDADANNSRGNLPYGEVETVEKWWDETGESALGTTAAGETAFEPRDVHKGNVARSMLYFAMRYGYAIDPSELALYQDWNHQDPVDAAEITRTLAIRDRQGVANPYVVCPDLADRL
jgi:hypothetical protein